MNNSLSVGESEIHQNNDARTVIWIASYPKSGNTWVQNVVREAGKSYGFPSKDLDVYKMMRESKKPDVVSGISSNICTDFATTVLKTHSAYSLDHSIHQNLNLKMVGFIYVIRNPLDMLLSYINFTRIPYANNKDNSSFQNQLFIDLLGFDKIIPYEEWLSMTLETIPRENLDHALKRFIEFDTLIPNLGMTGGSWMDHAFSWFKVSKSFPSVFLRYEDLLLGPENFLPIKKIFSFSELEIAEAVEVVNLRTRTLGKQPNKIFFNKMTSYYYLSFFSSNLISLFLKKYEDKLSIFGYDSLPKE